MNRLLPTFYSLAQKVSDQWIHWSDTIKDHSIFYSFDQTGFLRHQKTFKETEFSPIMGQRVLLTGGTSGIGAAVGKKLCQLGATLYFIGRRKEKGEKMVKEFMQLHPTVKACFFSCDLAEKRDVDNILHIFDEQHLQFDVLIHNAGSMPLELQRNSNQEEITFASQVLGPFRLSYHLIKRGLMAPKARIIWVSSGGMLLKKLDLTDVHFQHSSYNKFMAYANAKRAQVILSEMMNEKLAGLAPYAHPQFIQFSSMHPGWVETPGVKQSMPLFYYSLRQRLRTPKQGADTIVWLATTRSDYPSGQFWFDREIQNPYPLEWTKETIEEREALWNLALNGAIL